MLVQTPRKSACSSPLDCSVGCRFQIDSPKENYDSYIMWHILILHSNDYFKYILLPLILADVLLARQCKSNFYSLPWHSKQCGDLFLHFLVCVLNPKPAWHDFVITFPWLITTYLRQSEHDINVPKISLSTASAHASSPVLHIGTEAKTTAHSVTCGIYN